MNSSNRGTLKAVFLALAVTGIVSNSYGQVTVEKVDKIDRLVKSYAENGFNGSVLVTNKGNVIYKKGFGWANMEWNIPNQPDTKFRLASLTKQFTAMLIVQLVEQGKLKLDAPISTYLPDYPKKNGDIITIHHLLTHSSGVPNMTSFRGFTKNISINTYSPVQLVKFFADSSLQFKPGEKFNYSNSGYILLGYIIEQVTGKTYEQVLQENIFTPLGMNNSGYDHHVTLLKNRASGYEKKGWHYVNADFIDMSVPYAAGSIYSTVEDLSLWDQALYGNQLLRKENMELLFTNHVFPNDDYAYGWGIGKMRLGNTADRIGSMGHEGGINGFNTLITRIPSDKSLIVILNNTGGAPLSAMTRAIAAILYDKSYDIPKKSVARSLSNKVESTGIQTAIKFYNDVKDSTDIYYLDENEVNMTGYQFLEAGKASEAAAIFLLNKEAFPKSWNVYDSYGEALLALGNKTEALENYKRSVHLNPGNDGGIRILKDNGIKTDDLIKKVSIEYLKRLEGEYLNVDNKELKIKFNLTDGILYGDDRGYRYRVLPVEDGEFINPDNGASFIFDTKNKRTITLVISGTAKFNKVK